MGAMAGVGRHLILAEEVPLLTCCLGRVLAGVFRS